MKLAERLGLDMTLVDERRGHAGDRGRDPGLGVDAPDGSHAAARPGQLAHLERQPSGRRQRVTPLGHRRRAGVGGLADLPGSNVRTARPVEAPPSADPLAATGHLFYEVENKDGSLRPGQRVGMTLPVRGEEECLVVPRSAVLRDIHGGAWVYEKVGDHSYSRRRVIVDRIVGDLAALTMGPKPGAKIVTDGAAELFGTEFGGSK